MISLGQLSIVLLVVAVIVILDHIFLIPKPYPGLDHHRRKGFFRVKYPDGRISQPFTWGTARGYAKMYGGKVILK